MLMRWLSSDRLAHPFNCCMTCGGAWCDAVTTACTCCSRQLTACRCQLRMRHTSAMLTTTHLRSDAVRTTSATRSRWDSDARSGWDGSRSPPRESVHPRESPGSHDPYVVHVRKKANGSGRVIEPGSRVIRGVYRDTPLPQAACASSRRGRTPDGVTLPAAQEAQSRERWGRREAEIGRGRGQPYALRRYASCGSGSPIA
jgi:hypothetical protein